MKLVIVESPAKAKTIQKYLGAGFRVKSSYGHIRDLPKTKLGVDVENNFEPKYLIPKKAKKNVEELKKWAKKADEIYFATDEDREGEAIAWHLMEILKVKPEKAKRITFTEITKSAIKKAIENPRKINMAEVDAQQARRVLDRLVGYELSPLLWKKVRRGLSAGRVQSVAVRLITEREAEIEAFKPEEYWTLEAELLTKNNEEFIAKLVKQNDKPLDKLAIKNKETNDKIISDLKDSEFKVISVEKKEKKRTPPAPFITSTLQRTASTQLGYSSKQTMMIAQQLYENGFISYMRTDSVNLSKDATDAAQKVITNQYGKEYALPEARVFTKKAKGAQEAHEAIRPTDPTKLPADLTNQLDARQTKLYTLIWQRFTASQMAEARLNTVTAEITASKYGFRATGTTVLFDGYVKALGEKAAFNESLLPDLTESDVLDAKKLNSEQHFTQPPPRFSDASLVKALEENGIGRPSTYAPTIDTIQRREYVVKNEDKRFEPTEIGTIVNKLLTEHFPNIVDIDFTASMENSLDQVADGKKEWQPLIKSFYGPFHEIIEAKEKELSKRDFTEETTGESCPKCNSEVVIKLGRFGKFKACTNYPECKHTESIGEEKKMQEEHSGQKCPDCGKDLVVKRGRFGPFLGCSGYPDCKHITKIEQKTGVTCPKCNKGDIIEKRSKRGKTFYACNQYPDCDQAYWSKPTGESCPECKSLLIYGPKGTAKCSSKECSFTKQIENEE